jgi:uncharacterized protein (DUF1501 family)
MNSFRLNRRNWLAGVGSTALLARLGHINALAQFSPPDYKALVCIFLVGGNDGHNTIVPLAQSEFDAYRAARGSLALPDGNGPLSAVETVDQGVPYGLNPGLLPIHPLWAQRRLAVLANVGMLVQPVSRSQYLANAIPVPTNLFSHSDQIQQMHTGFPSTSGGSGWGGRVADQVAALNGSSTFPASISIAGPALFSAGTQVQSASLLPGYNLDPSGMELWPAAAATARKTGLQEVLSLSSGLTLVQTANQIRKDALHLNSLLTGTNTTLGNPFPGDRLGQQLEQVAKIIKLRGSVGMNRQVFFCALGGFDTHGAQSWQHWDLLRQVGEAMAAFQVAMDQMGVADRVTTFTLSEFGRSLQPSGQGSDHGWGSHHLIAGGAVQGGRIFGTFPSMALGGPDDSGSRGTLIPTTSVDQYGATLASWFGVPPALLPAVFPNLDKFGTQNLGFLGSS